MQKTGRFLVLFQPHRYTRTRDLMREFSLSFTDADVLIVLDIYPAGEQMIEGVHSTILTDKIREAGFRDVLYMEDRGKATDHIAAQVREGDVVLTLGAGNVWKAGEEILAKLRVNKVKQA